MRQTDPRGETNLSWSHHISGGALNGEFSDLRVGADDSYYYTKLNVSREQDIGKGAYVKLNLTAQYATENLLQSEQLGMGGYGTVRGYKERVYRADTGLVGQLELYSPILRPVTYLMESPKVSDELRFLTFVDFGVGDSHESLTATDEGQSLMSVGLGFRYSWGNNLSLRVDWAKQIKELSSPPFPGGDDSQFHVGFVFSF